MKIAYNPKTAAALTTAPANNDITFDLSGLSIYVKGVRFKGTDTTYSVFKKHGSSGGGYDGLVPVPNYNNDSKTRFLREDGTWVIPTDSHYTTHLYVGAQSVSNNNNSNASTTNGNTYIKLFDNSTLRHQYLIKGSGNTTVNSDASGNITINSPTTISWGNVTEKPGSFTPATHYHNLLTNWPDTRAVATTPNDYNAVASNGGVFKVVGIKTSGTTLGLTSPQAGSYATIIGWRGWRDSSGGYAWEIASTDKNRLYVRSGGTTSWNNDWSAIAYTTDTYPTSQINKLIGYSKATSDSALSTSDSLNTALGKLEYKGDLGITAYNLVNAAYDGDGTIENLKEILKVLEGIKDTETIKGLLGKYLPLAGGTMTLGEGLKFHADENYFGTNLDARIISLLDENGTVCDGGLIIDERCTSNGATTVTELLRIRDAEFKWKGQNILHSGNSNIQNGVITINGVSITPVTAHQSLANYVTLNTEQTITGIKTFTKQQKFTVAKDTAPFQVTSDTKVDNLNADLLDGYHSTSYLPYTIYDYEKGCLVKTDIPAKSHTMVTFIIEGNSYNANSIFTTGEFYNYSVQDEILQYGAYHHGYNFGNITVFCYDGYVYIWFKQSRAFQSFVVTVYGTNTTPNNTNRVTSITNAALPTTGITRKVEITPRISLNSSNYTSYIKESNFPGLNKVGTVTSVAIANGGGLSVAGSPITTSGTITITNTGVRSVTIGTNDNANKVAVNTGGTTTYLTIPYAIYSTHLIGGVQGSIPYQSAADTTTFLAAPTTNGYVLKYNTTDKKPYWAVDSDTKNTAGSTNSTSKLFLIGATSQGTNPQTYSNSSVYTTNGTLYATSFIGNLDGTYVNKLTNYKIATTIGSIATTDSLNTALGKLEFKTDFIYNDLFGTDNDDVINKWHEIVDFIDSVKEGTDILDEFVTRKTAQTISGIKTFSTQQNFAAAQGTAPFTVTSTTKIDNLNADLLDGKYLSNAVGNIPYIVKFPSFSNFGSSHSTINYEKNILKWVYTNQNYGNDTLLIGVGVPNSKGNLQIQLYGTDGVDSSTGYPTYSSAIYYPLKDRPICFGTYDHNFYSYSLAFYSDIKDPADYYWANIQVSSSSSTTTTPIFATATATTSVTTPLVTSSGVLTLNGVSGVYLKYNSSDEAAIVLSSTYFKPFDTANNKLSLGTNSARWSNIYSVLGNYSGNITALGFVKSGSSDNYVLLGGGGHKLASDFMLKTDELSNNLTTITKSLSVTQAWMDTGITSTNLPANGTYIVQVQVSANDDIGHMWWCYNSGVMSWYKDATNDTETDEIILHRSGHAYGKTIYLRTIMQSSGVLKLQIGASSNIGNAYTYTFKFKRII